MLCLLKPMGLAGHVVTNFRQHSACFGFKTQQQYSISRHQRHSTASAIATPYHPATTTFKVANVAKILERVRRLRSYRRLLSF